MNFCKFYNITMNWLEYIDFKHLEQHSEEKINEIRRKNSKSINIFIGIFYLVIYFGIITLLLFIASILTSIYKLLLCIFNFTNSKCDKEE